MVTIGITTHNRKNIVAMMAKSLLESLKGESSYSIRIYDDASDEYDVSFLKELFPQAKTIVRHEKNLGSSGNIQYMYRDFLQHDDQFLFNADADLIFSENWLEKGLELIKKTDGIISLFNTREHATINEDELVCEKPDIGSAGTLIERSVVEEICEGITYDIKKGFDYAWCELLKSHGKKIYSTKASLVQHIGLTGVNSKNNRFDYGDNFIVDSIVNGQILNDVINEYAYIMNDYWSHHRTDFFLFPYEKVAQGSKVIIYGYGNVGKDFVNQITASGYCEIVGIVDKNHDKSEDMISTDDIDLIDYDYILIATINKQFNCEIVEVLKAKKIYNPHKVIEGGNYKRVLYGEV